MRKQLITLIIVLGSATVVSTMARAAGDTKNQAPFTRLMVQAQTESRGEAKNELPFTATRVTVTVPDAFERYASAHPYGRGIAVARSIAEGDVLSRYLLSRWGIRMS